MRSTIWFPEKETDKTFKKKSKKQGYSFRLGFEGVLHPVVAEAIVALQMHQRKLTPEMEESLRAMTVLLKKRD